MKKRKVIVVTGIRSEFDLMTPVFNLLRIQKNIDLKFIVTGAHLSSKYGLTINLIKKEKFKILTKIHSLLDNNSPESRLKAIGIQIQSIVEPISNYNPDLIIVTGDREEALVGATVGAYLNIAVAHFAGGDKSVGNIDDMVRHSVTKLANIHFCFSKQSEKRLQKMGEQEFRIFNIGNPGIDRLKIEKKISIAKLNSFFNFNLNEKFIVCIQHPVSSEYKLAKEHIKYTLQALEAINIPTVIIYPNSDAGSELIINEILKFKKNPNFKVYKHIDRQYFINLLRYSSCLVGNSSMGILESEYLKLPTVNIGNRQSKRESNINVIDVEYDKQKIIKAITRSLSESFKENCKKIKPIYGNGNSSKKAVEIISSIKIDNKLLIKDLTY